MKAVVYDRYGPPDVLHFEDVPRPEPKDDEILIRIHATTVNRLDCHTREANRSNGPVVSVLSRLVSGVRAPRQRILGSELAGEVEQVGAAVTQFKAGDRVFANTGLGLACHTEYKCVRESARVASIPDGMSFAQAAPMTDGALNALWCLRLADLVRRKTVLVYGASGAIGSAGVQLARHFGAEVTAVCTAATLDLARSLGAAEAIDYRAQDFTKSGKTYDVIFDAVGKETFARCKSSLKPGGAYLATDGFRNLFLAMWTSRFGDKKVMFQLPPVYAKSDVLFLKELAEKGEYRPVIDRTYALDQVIEATKYVETQQKVGNVVLTVSPAPAR
ncbi:MAG TPA: NAD(P)-dependent alcohol dehydrogenase [Candidatus Dormibacteraeota bacterium]|nr:NAD(P)-dependent alcohol dehydrogenase [Candidatus Dormibacteraeota bacterium]